jgi:hypothetical protein
VLMQGDFGSLRIGFGKVVPEAHIHVASGAPYMILHNTASEDGDL